MNAGQAVVFGDGLLELGHGVVLKIRAAVGLAKYMWMAAVSPKEASISEKIFAAPGPSPRSRSATASS
jgi:hypothetical protein